MTVGYGIYILMLLADGVQPNATSWSLWALGGAIEAWSFRKVIQASHLSSTKRWWLGPFEYTPIVCAVSAVVIAFLGITLGKFEAPEPWEYVIATFDLVVVAAYFLIKSKVGEMRTAARSANLLMVLDIFLSFIPIWVSTLMFPEGEVALPWAIWTASYLMLGAMGWSQFDTHWKERRWLIIYPVTSAVFHGLVAVIVILS